MSESTTGNGLHFDATIDDSQFKASISQMDNDIGKFVASTQEQLTAIKNFAKETEAAVSATPAAGKNLAEGALVLTRAQIKEQIDALPSLFTGHLVPIGLLDQLDKLKAALNLTPGEELRQWGEEAKKASPSFTILNDKLVGLQVNKKAADGISAKKEGGLSGFLASLDPEKKGVGAGAAAGLADISSALSTFSVGLKGTNADAAYTLDTIGQLVGAAADLAGAIILGNPQKIIQSGIKAVGTLFSLSKKTSEANAAARKEVADFYSNAIKGEKEYQDMLVKRQLDSIRDNKTNLNGILDEVALRKSQLAGYKSESDDIITKLQGMSSIASETYTHGTWFRKAEVNKTYSSLKGITDFATLNNLLAQGKLEGDAKTLVERLKELEQEGYDAQKAIDDLAASTAKIFTGTTSDDLTNSLADMFANGKTSAQDLADFFRQTMDDAALSIFKNTVLANAMDKFYEEFAEKTEDGNVSEQDKTDLQTLFNSLTDDAKKQFELLKGITGSDVTSLVDAAPAENTSGAIKSITTDQADKLSGLFNGFRINQIETNSILNTSQTTAMSILSVAVNHFDSSLAIEANTLRTANNTNRLENIEKALTSMDNKIASTTNILQGTGRG